MGFGNDDASGEAIWDDFCGRQSHGQAGFAKSDDKDALDFIKIEDFITKSKLIIFLPQIFSDGVFRINCLDGSGQHASNRFSVGCGAQ